MVIESLIPDKIKRGLYQAGALGATSVVLAYLVVRYETTGFVLGLGILGAVIFLFAQLHVGLHYQKTLFFVPFIVCTLPLQRIFLTALPMLVAAQLLVFPVILSYFNKWSSERSDYLQRIRSLIFPTIAFAASLILSYAVSGEWGNADWGFIFSLLGSIGYAYLACVYCGDLKRIKRLLWILIGIGVIQLPIMYAMGRGWTNHLPGPLSKLNTESWGGLASAGGTTALRYPGLFRDYELLAEFLALMMLFCLGFALFTSSRRERMFSIGAAFLIMVAGFYTGTRAFAIGLGVGFATMVILIIGKPDLWKKLKRILMLGIILVSAFLLLSTQEIFRGYMGRLMQTDIRPGYYDSRTDVWTKSFSMMRDLPFTGYGTQMTRMFESIGYTSPHSLYFSMFLKAGYPGILAILVLVGSPFLWMARILWQQTRKLYHPWAIVILSVWSCWVVNEIKIEFIRYPFYMNIIFLVIGMFASYYHLAISEPLYPQERRP